MTIRRLLTAFIAVLLLVVAASAAQVAKRHRHHSTRRATTAAPTWAPASSAAIHPGVQTRTDGSQCTANFVYYDGSGVYLGQAAHCSGTGGSTDTNGCPPHSPAAGGQGGIGGRRPGGLGVQSGGCP